MTKPILYLIRGIPGSGKSTFAKTLIDFGVVEYALEADNYFINFDTGEYKFDASKLSLAHKNCQDFAKLWLKRGKSIAVSNTSTTEKEVEIYKKIAQEFDAVFISVIIENRHEGKNVHNVPEEKVQQMKNRFSIKL